MYTRLQSKFEKDKDCPGSYWICSKCAKKDNATFPIFPVTSTIGTCAFCGEKKVSLIPQRDFKWPKESQEAVDARWD